MQEHAPEALASEKLVSYLKFTRQGVNQFEFFACFIDIKPASIDLSSHYLISLIKSFLNSDSDYTVNSRFFAAVYNMRLLRNIIEL